MSETRDRVPMSSTQVTMMEIVMPNDANSMGNVFGGRVMSLIDIAGAMSALRLCRMPVVTASVDRVDFRAPIRVGEFIILHANVNYTGRTSLEVGVKVFGEHPLTGEHRHTSTAYLTYVALDPEGKPAAIPQVVPETEAEQAWYAAAQERRAQRLTQTQKKE